LNSKVRLLTGAAILFAALPVAAFAGDLAATMRLAVDGLVASQTEEGLFRYGFDFLADKPLEADRMSAANLIRQAGTVSVLAAYYRQTQDARLLDPVRRALTALGGHSLPFGKSRAQYWIERTHLLSLPFGRWKLQSALDRLGLLYESTGAGKVVSPSADYGEALTGAAALALLAELHYAAAAGDERFADLRLAWLDGLLMLRVPGGAFRATPTSIDDSDYFNGEAWLALAVYADLRRSDARTGAELDDLDQALIERYTLAPSRNFFHWGAMAAAQRFATTGSPRFSDFVRAQADWFIARLRTALDPDSNHCATMEGVAAALATLNRAGEGETARAQSLRTWLAEEAARLPALQIQLGQTRMALGGQAQLTAPRMIEFPGAFLRGWYLPSVRVDLNQHCVSAMLMIDRDRLLLPSR
jgi:hypothetical protein